MLLCTALPPLLCPYPTPIRRKSQIIGNLPVLKTRELTHTRLLHIRPMGYI